MNSKERAQLAVVSTDIKWIKEKTKDIVKKLDKHIEWSENHIADHEIRIKELEDFKKFTKNHSMDKRQKIGLWIGILSLFVSTIINLYQIVVG